MHKHPFLQDELKFLELPSQVLNLQTSYNEQVALNQGFQQSCEQDMKLAMKVLSYQIKGRDWKKSHVLAQQLFKRSKNLDNLYQSVYYNYKSIKASNPDLTPVLGQFKLLALFLSKFFSERQIDLNKILVEKSRCYVEVIEQN